MQPKPLRDLLQAGRCIGLRDPGHGAVQLSVGDGNLVAQQDGFEQCQAVGGCRVGVDKREKKTTFFAGRGHYVFPTIVGARLKIGRYSRRTKDDAGRRKLFNNDADGTGHPWL